MSQTLGNVDKAIKDTKFESISAEGSSDIVRTLSVEVLTKLPPEVLKSIWDHFRARDCTGPICKSLLHYHQAVKFGFIRLQGFASLRRLYLAFLFNPGLAAFCRSIEIWGLSGELESEQALYYLGSVLSLMVKVTEVYLWDCPSASRLTFNPDFAKISFPQLKDISITIDTTDSKESLQSVSGMISNFRLYPSLEEIGFIINRRRDVPVPSTAPRSPLVEESPSFTLPRITSLSLGGEVDAQLAQYLLKRLPSLIKFDYNPARPSGADFIATLTACPSTLVKLESFNDTESDDEDDDNHQDPDWIDDHLKRFKNLEKLTLCNANFSSHIFRHLGDPLPLKDLTLGECDMEAVHVEDLKNLIDPKSPHHNSHLKSIYLRIVSGYIGKAAAADDLDPHLGPSLDDWEVPEWIDGQMDYRGVKELVQLGELHGVEVSGPTVEALAVQDAVDREWKRWRRLSKAMGPRLI